MVYHRRPANSAMIYRLRYRLLTWSREEDARTLSQANRPA
jgi:hypothetical protein